MCSSSELSDGSEPHVPIYSAVQSRAAVSAVPVLTVGAGRGVPGVRDGWVPGRGIPGTKTGSWIPDISDLSIFRINSVDTAV